MSVDLPAPGTPLMPTRMALPVRGRRSSSRRWARTWSSGLALSIRVMARPSATRSPPTMALAASSKSLREACFALMACGVKRKHAEAQDGSSAAQHADHLAGEAQAFGHHRDHIAEQRLVQRAVFGFEALVSLEAEGVEHAVQLGLNGGAAHLPGNEPHLADRGVRPEAAHAHRASVVELDHDADASFENEMHAVGEVALRGDNVVLAHFEPLATGGELLGEVGTAERLREPFT